MRLPPLFNLVAPFLAVIWFTSFIFVVYKLVEIWARQVSMLPVFKQSEKHGIFFTYKLVQLVPKVHKVSVLILPFII